VEHEHSRHSCRHGVQAADLLFNRDSGPWVISTDRATSERAISTAARTSCAYRFALASRRRKPSLAACTCRIFSSAA